MCICMRFSFDLLTYISLCWPFVTLLTVNFYMTSQNIVCVGVSIMHENENEQSVIFYDESSARPALLKRSHEVGQPVRVLLQGLHQQIDAVETIVIVQE